MKIEDNRNRNPEEVLPQIGDVVAKEVFDSVYLIVKDEISGKVRYVDLLTFIVLDIEFENIKHLQRESTDDIVLNARLVIED